MKAIENKKDHTLLALMTLQSTFTVLIFQLCSFTDTWLVSKNAGVLASAGIGILSPVFFVLSGISTTVGTGAASLLSISFGQNDSEKMEKVVVNTWILFVLTGALFAVVGEVFLESIVKMYGVSGVLYDSAITYGRIVIAGAVVSTGFSSLMRATGQLKYATLQWVLPLTTNFILDILFVSYFKWGVSGAAWATIISYFISFVTSTYYFLCYKNKPYKITKKSFLLDISIMREIVMIGSPSLFQKVSSSFLAVTFQKILLMAGGEIVFAAYVLTDRVVQLFWTPHTGIAQGVQLLVGYFDGKREVKRKHAIISKAITYSVLYGTGSMVICKCLFPIIVPTFSTDYVTVEAAKGILNILLWAFPVKGVGSICVSAFQAEGNIRKSWMLSIFSIVGIQLPCVLLGGTFWGVTGAFVSIVLSEVLFSSTAILMSWRNRNGKSNKK